MALIHCSECHGRLSEKAKACPHCGAPYRTRASELRRRKAWDVFSVAVGIACAATVAYFAGFVMWQLGAHSRLAAFAFEAVALLAGLYVGLAVSSRSWSAECTRSGLIEMQEWAFGLVVFAITWAPFEPLFHRKGFFAGMLGPAVVLIVLLMFIATMIRRRIRRRVKSSQ